MSGKMNHLPAGQAGITDVFFQCVPIRFIIAANNPLFGMNIYFGCKFGKGLPMPETAIHIDQQTAECGVIKPGSQAVRQTACQVQCTDIITAVGSQYCSGFFKQMAKA